MQILTTTVARLLYSVPFFIFGINHFLYGPMMAGMVPTIFPGGVFWVYLTGAAFIAAAIAIASKKQAALASKLLALMLFIFIVTIHIPALGNSVTQQMSIIALLKDTALMGAALAFAGIFESESV